ncbi:hypothetical protein [Desertimonas flava]|uniref:hypothetical protein n=1 Tax=Desertimonas flava TaxID=2064846 RepID=UPI000E341305|nr:hypothetical protein [Desertimonas flava]
MTIIACELRQYALIQAAGLIDRLGFDPVAVDDWPDLCAADNALDLASASIAEAAEWDPSLVAEAAAGLDRRRLVGHLLWATRIMVEQSLQPDERRAEQLARLACVGVPARAQSFAPRHAQMALDILEAVHPTVPWGEVVPIDDARARLVRFAEQACALA